MSVSDITVSFKTTGPPPRGLERITLYITGFPSGNKNNMEKRFHFGITLDLWSVQETPGPPLGAREVVTNLGRKERGL